MPESEGSNSLPASPLDLTLTSQWPLTASIQEFADLRQIPLDQAVQQLLYHSLDVPAIDVKGQPRRMIQWIPSSRIGLAAMEQLRAIDQIAYIRFASVYQSFEDLEDLKREVDSLFEERGTKSPRKG